MAIKKRKDGYSEQPHIKLGIFKMRLPFLHFNISLAELIQGIILVAIPMIVASIAMETLGAPFEVGLAIAIIFIGIEFLHPMMGDPVVPGFITPAIPLVLAHLNTYAPGEARIKALMAVQLMVAAIFLLAAFTGFSKKIMKVVPVSLRSGILLGAGIASVMSCIKVGGRLDGRMISSIIGVAITLFIMYAVKSKELLKHHKIYRKIAEYGLLPGAIVAIIIGVIIGEMEIPQVEFGMSSVVPFIDAVKQYSIFHLGVPELSYFIQGLPLAISAYIIAFGDTVLAEAVIDEIDEARNDEHIEFNPTRSNLISGVRNLFFGLLAPVGVLCGPLWSGGTIATGEHYKQGRKAMDSFYDGCGSFVIGMFLALLFTPVVSLFKPALQLAMILILMVQGYASGYIGINMLSDNNDKSIAYITALVISMRSIAAGLIVGVALVALIKFSGKNAAANEELVEGVE